MCARHEIQIMRELTHPRIVNLLEAFWKARKVRPIVSNDAASRPKDGLALQGRANHEVQTVNEESLCRTLKSTKIRGVPKSEFSGSQKGGIKGEVKRGEVMGE